MKISKIMETLITDCMQASKYDVPIVIFDDHGKTIAEQFIKISKSHFLNGVRSCFIPLEYQLYIGGDDELPSVIRQSIALSTHLLTATTDFDDCTAFRRLVIECGVSNNLKIIHMPGVDEELLEKSIDNIDLIALHEVGLPIYELINKSSTIEITTIDNAGKVHVLKSSIKNRNAHMCGGIAQPGEIMNFPTGEVYVAPLETKTNGELVLNGTTGLDVLPIPEEIILSVEKGVVNINKSNFPTTSRSRRFKEELESIYKKNPLYLTVCEIGVGTNCAVKRLTGNEVWDEKSLGTSHIALGANNPFGGTIRGDFHRDIIFYPSKIKIGNNVLDIKWSVRSNK